MWEGSTAQAAAVVPGHYFTTARAECGCHPSAGWVAGRIHMEFFSGGLLQSLLEARLLLVALHPGKDCRDSHMCCLCEMWFPTSVGNNWAYPVWCSRTTAPGHYELANTLRGQQPPGVYCTVAVNTSLNSSTSAWASRHENWVLRTAVCEGATGNYWFGCLTVFSQRVLHWSVPKNCPHFRFIREVPGNSGRCFVRLLMDFFTF